ALAAHRSAGELPPKNVRNSVMLRQPLVHEAVVRRHEIENATIPVDDALEEQLHLTDHRPAQVVVEVRELERVRYLVAKIAEIEPLSREIAHERFGLWIRQHAPNLSIEHCRILQLTALGHVEQRFVRNAAPQEERQTRRERSIGKAVDRPRSDSGRIRFDAQQKLGAGKYAAQGHVDATVERAGLLPPLLIKLD